METKYYIGKELTICDFFKSKEITVKEIEEKFVLVKEYDIDMTHQKGCPHCKDTANQYNWKSEPWTGIIECIACKSIILTFFADRMGGNYTDTVKVYEQKNRPMFELYFKCDIQKDCIECRYCGTISSDKEDIEKRFCKKCNKSLEPKKQDS